MATVQQHGRGAGAGGQRVGGAGGGGACDAGSESASEPSSMWPRAGGGGVAHPHHPAGPAACFFSHESVTSLSSMDTDSASCASGCSHSDCSSISSCASSECGEAPPSPPPAAAAAGGRHPLSRLGAMARATPAAAPPGVVAWCWGRKTQRGVARAAMDTLVAAMADDPVNAFLLGGTPSAKFAKKELKGFVKALPKARHFIATPDAAAVALWQLMPEETPRNELLAGWTRIFRVPLKLWPALVSLELRYEAAHARVAASAPGGSYYYLSFIATAPAARGKGYASQLLRHMTSRADAEGRLCLLEATSPMSRALYERHGFVTYETYRVTPRAPPVFFMSRDPRPLPAPAAPAAAAPAVAALERKASAAAAAALAASAGGCGGDGLLIPSAVVSLGGGGGGAAGKHSTSLLPPVNPRGREAPPARPAVALTAPAAAAL